MKPRPFYRWKSFWLGLFVLAFLWWAGGDSLKGGHSRGVLCVVSSQGLLLARNRAETIIGFGSGVALGNGLQIWSEPYSYHSSPPSWQGGWAHGKVWYLVVPDALVFFSFSGLWSAWLVWHWKREQKKSL